MRRAVTIFAGFVGFLVGVTLAFLVLDVWMGRPELAGSKLSVVIALAPAIGAYEVTDRLWGWLAGRRTSAETSAGG
jgi:hypothetical protein